jgi:hypothetical protein
VVSAVTDNVCKRSGGSSLGRSGSLAEAVIGAEVSRYGMGRMTVWTGIVRSDRQNRAVVVGLHASKGERTRGDQRLLSSPHKSMNRGRQNQHDNGNNLIVAPVRPFNLCSAIGTD